MATETPKYAVLEKDGNIEIRQYESFVEAFIELNSDYDSALGQGFNALAGYIFGGNQRREHFAMTAPVTEFVKTQPEKISMTTPVFARANGMNSHVISFMMPSKYTLESLPTPNNPEIHFRKVEPYKAAVLSFSGYLNPRKVRGKTEELLARLATKKLLPKSEVSSAQYNPPWTPGFFRRNEIIVEI